MRAFSSKRQYQYIQNKAYILVQKGKLQAFLRPKCEKTKKKMKKQNKTFIIKIKTFYYLPVSTGKK